MKSLLKTLYTTLRRGAWAYRYHVAARCRAYEAGLTVNFYSVVKASAMLDTNVNLNGIIIRRAGKVLAGKNFHSGQGCLILTANHHNCGTAIQYAGTVISRNLHIHDNVWPEDRVIIPNGVTLEEGVIVQAGSLVTKSVPKYAIVGGHPAPVFKYRDCEHYDRLTAEGRFH